MRNHSPRPLQLLSAALCLFGAAHAWAQGSGFTFQGRLADNGVPANASYDIRFTLFDSSTGGAQVGNPIVAAPVVVQDGVFERVLDFGAGAFPGAARWLEMSVRPNGSTAAYTVLAPRQLVTATPYAITALQVTGPLADAQLSANIPRLNQNETFSGAINFAPASGPPFAVGGSAKVANLNADLLDGLDSSAFWKTAGNSGTGSANFIGTTDNQPLEIRVNGTPAVRVVPTTSVANFVGGLGAINPPQIGAGVRGAVVAGGGAPAGPVNGYGGGDLHQVTDSDCTIVGGFGNKVGNGNASVDDAPFSTVAGGVFNTASGYAATVIGGDGNQATGSRAGVGGGYGNVASGDMAAITGGMQAHAKNYGQLAHASGAFAAAGDAQSSDFVLRVQTTGAFTTEMTLDGNTQRMTIPSGATWAFDMLVVARVSTGNSIAWQIKGVVKNDNGTVAMVGTPQTTVLGQDLISATVTLQANTPNQALAIFVSGINNAVTRWVASVRTLEVGFL